MGVKVSWYNDDYSAIRCAYIGKWNWDDWRWATGEAIRLRETTPDKPIMPIIVDLRESASTPFGALANGKRSADMHDERDIFIFLGGNLTVKSLLVAFTSVFGAYKSRIFWANSVDEVEQIIRQYQAIAAAEQP